MKIDPDYDAPEPAHRSQGARYISCASRLEWMKAIAKGYFIFTPHIIRSIRRTHNLINETFQHHTCLEDQAALVIIRSPLGFRALARGSCRKVTFARCITRAEQSGYIRWRPSRVLEVARGHRCIYIHTRIRCLSEKRTRALALRLSACKPRVSCCRCCRCCAPRADVNWTVLTTFHSSSNKLHPSLSVLLVSPHRDLLPLLSFLARASLRLSSPISLGSAAARSLALGSLYTTTTGAPDVLLGLAFLLRALFLSAAVVFLSCRLRARDSGRLFSRRTRVRVCGCSGGRGKYASAELFVCG